MEIAATGLTAGYRRATILHDVDFSVRAGELVGLIGPNGSGKTTLLRLLANLRPPQLGSVRYAGRTASELGGRELARRVAYLAQGGVVHWTMRVDNVIALGRLPHRRPFHGPSAEDHRAIERAMMAAEVSQFRDRTMSQVSGGERTRILLARALAVEAEILLADEPIAALDPLHQLHVLELLRRSVRQGRGVVVVLHDLALAARFCDRLVLLANGGVLAQGEPEEVLTDSNLINAFGVKVLRGSHDGVPFVLPWAPSHAAGAGDQ